MNRIETFAGIYRRGGWGGESKSGEGSSLEATAAIREALPRIVAEYGISSVLDAPCGDYHWMQTVDLGALYIGVDLVPEMIDVTRARYATDAVTFDCLDIVADQLPTADLIVCRDTLQHLSYGDVWATLRNFKATGARYLLVTSYADTATNRDIETGGYRPLNLAARPFDFPAPLLKVDESGLARNEPDKAMYLYDLAEIPSEQRPPKVAILVPRRADNGRRDELWAFTRAWLTKHHPDYEIVEGDSPEGLFNRGAALNAARAKTDADVLVIHDGDNIIHPDKLREAVRWAHDHRDVVFPHDFYVYMETESTRTILDNPDGMWFPRPRIDRRMTNTNSIIERHISGICAVPADVWDACGGFIELAGWSSEDSIFHLCCEVIQRERGKAIHWLPGTALHLFHDHAAADTARDVVRGNRAIYAQVKAASRRGLSGLRTVALQHGHVIP